MSKPGLGQALVTIKTVVVRLDRTIQYTAASRLYRWRLWNTGSPAQSRAMTTVYMRPVYAQTSYSNFKRRADTRPHSRGAARPRYASVSPFPRKKGAGKAGRRLHPRSCAQCAHEWTTGSTGSSGFPRTMGYGLYVFRRRQLAAPSVCAPHAAHEVRLALRLQLRARRCRVHRIPPRVRDVRNAPRRVRRRITKGDLPDVLSEIFLFRGLDTISDKPK